MKIQDYLIQVTEEAMTEVFTYAKAVPADKRDWKPQDKGRSVLELARELGKCPDWALSILGGMGEDPAPTESDTWATVEDCEAAGREKLARYLAFIADFPDEKLTETQDLPFGAGGSMKTFTMLEMMDYPRWNASYHQGQIAYIQTLYGDKDLH